MSSPAPESVLAIEIDPGRAPRGRSALACLGVAALITFLLFQLIAGDSTRRSSADELVPILAIALFFGLAVGTVFFLFNRASAKKQGGATLVLAPEGIVWQSKAGPALGFPYRNLWFAGWAGRGRSRALRFSGATPGTGFTLPLAAFPEPGLATTALAEAERRIAALPGAEALRYDLARRRDLNDRLLAGRAVATWALGAVAVLGFVLEMAAGAFSDGQKLAALGANAPALVAQGEWFRLATATFLHGSVLHLLANLWALFVFGRELEPLLGTGRFLTIFLASSLTGSALSAVVGLAPLSVGASTGLYGLLGAYFVLGWRWADQLPTPPLPRRWLSLVWYFVFPALVIRRVDNLAHVGGFAGGCLLMLLVPKAAQLIDLPQRQRGLYRTAAALLVALFLFAASQTPWVRSGDWRRDLGLGGAPAALVAPPRPPL